MRRLALIASLILFVGLNAMFAQTTTITGTITDSESGEVMPGVSVVVRGTTIGTVTNVDGNYSLSVPSDATNLLYSFVGMKTQDILIDGRTNINVVLVSETVGVDEVVVMGYTTARKSEVTGSAVKVSGEDLANMPVADVQQALQGKVAGVSIASTSGTPGSVQNVRIRGRSSITAGNDPLYVVNGVPLNTGNASATSSGSSLSDLVSLNSNDVESITVLKDAAATAAYGARGANGVIVITTKTGKSGKADINFSATYGVSNDAMDGPGVLTGADREMLFYEAIKNTWGFNNSDEAKAYYEANPSTFGTDYVTWNAAGRPETNWGDIITNKNAPMQEYNLSASGGTDKMNYYTSFGYFNQEATVIGSDFERFSGNVNLSTNLTDKLTFSTNNSAAHSYQDGLLETSAYFSSPRTTKFFMPSIDQAYNEDGSINYATTSLPNPLWIAQEDVDDSKLTKIISNNSLSWETPITGLRLTSRMSIDYQVYNYKRYRNPLRGDGDGETKGYGWQAHSNRVNYVFQNSADYSFDLDGGHNFDVKALVEYQKNKYYFLEADADNFSDFGLTNLNSAGNPTTANSYFTDWSRAAYIGMIHYSYQGRYVLDVTYTREGSSRFHPDHRWGNFYGVGAAWNMHQESFMSGMDFLSNFKLRASYGVTGNANIDLNQYQSLLNYDGDYAGEGASYPGTFGNDELSWETSHTLDIGLDFGFFSNRISGAIGYYRRETKDMLLDVPLSLTTGFVEQTRNIGRMENKGIEFELDVDIIRSNDFNLSVGGNFGTAKNEVLELAKDLNGEEVNITSTTQRVETGHPVYGWYMPTWAGVNPDTGDEMWYINQNESDATTTNFNDAEQVWQGGSAIPEFVAGMNLHVDYKGFFADINGVYAGGHKIYEGWHRYTNGTDVFSVAYYQGVDVLLDRWQQPGDQTRFGKFEYTGRPWQRHSKFLYDGDYFRLRDLTVGYDFPKSITNKIKLGGLRVFAKGLNLYTWVKDDNLQYDPETVDSDGETSLTTPAVKSFIFGVNVKF